MKLYGSVASRARRCLWTLEEAGADYEFRKVDFASGEHRSDEYLRLNPNGKVPLLIDGDLVLFESGAICNYVADKHPDAALIPKAGTAERALHDQWMMWVLTELEQPLWTMGKHSFVFPPERRIKEMLPCAQWEWQRPTKILAEALEGRDYLLGDRFGVVDIMAGHTLYWARAFKVPLGHDVLERYLEKLLARPAFEATRKL